MIRNKRRISTLTTFNSTYFLKSYLKQREKKKKKGKFNLSKKLKFHCFDDTIHRIYTEDCKNTTRKLLELINEFGKVAGYKINTQKSVAFLFTNNKRSERKIQETLPFTNTSKRIKY